MDILLTNMSTIVYEAVDCGVTAAVCTAQGATIFDDLIEAEKIVFAENETDILDLFSAIDPTKRNLQRSQPSALSTQSEVQLAYDRILADAGLT